MGGGGSKPESIPTPTFTTITTHTPLTTTFTAPDDCWTTPYYVPDPTGWFEAGGETSSCFPPGFAFSETVMLYSPGICPAGWKSACESYSTPADGGAAVQMAVSTDFVVFCCPISMKCVKSRSESDSDREWESTMGCVSSYHVDAKSWFPDQTDAKRTYMKSMYQRPVMIMAPPTTTAPPVAHRTSNSTTHAGLSTAKKAGISVGAIAVAAILIGLIVFILRRVKRKHVMEQTESGRPESSLEEPSGPFSWTGPSDNAAHAVPRRHGGGMTESDGGTSIPPMYEP
ncbi:hypothetical protein BDV96DRAFT_574852 [Lophiotrema nucula]|uniref:Uncharacterized protein n=1 Tax=Lophiotrema nucula TaxID=690887 RepID=A0A6A5Z9J9_9PLEO|nr:hypothetical protein BDV96DRAFT_574852 [Lophiotrema nucula]